MPRTVRLLVVTRQPASTLSNVTSAEIVRRSGGVPARPSPAENAIAKQEACAAAKSSSGLVLPPGSSVRAGQLTGVSRKMPLETALTVPCPVARSPDQTASARRTCAMSSSCPCLTVHGRRSARTTSSAPSSERDGRVGSGRKRVGLTRDHPPVCGGTGERFRRAPRLPTIGSCVPICATSVPSRSSSACSSGWYRPRPPPRSTPAARR